jgi:hypothetical protein
MKHSYFLLVMLAFALTTVGQNSEDTTDGRFHDELLNHFVGKWTVSGTVHGQEFKNIDLQVEWVLNHQFLQIHEKGRDIVPWLQTFYESFLYIGYDHPNKRYVGHLMNVFGGDDQLAYLFFGTRTNNEINFVSKFSDQTGNLDSETFTWKPESKSWHWIAKLVNKGKEEQPYLELDIIPNK